MHYQICDFTRSQKIKQKKNLKIHFLHWVETDVLSLDRMAVETRNDPVLGRIISRIRKNIWGNCSRAYKEIRHKLTIEHGVIYNEHLIIPPETQTKLVIKNVHDIHCGVVATQKRIKLEAWWLGYSRDIKEYIKRCKKCKELRTFTQITLHLWPREGEPSSPVHMDYAYITGVRLLLILVDSFSKNPGIQQCTGIL